METQTLTVQEVIDVLKKFPPDTKCLRADNMGGYEKIFDGEIKLEKGIIDNIHQSLPSFDAVIIGHV
jgi:hypothetical protein